MRGIELTGSRFGRLIVIERYKSIRKQWYWVCKCDCGKTTIVKAALLRSGNTKSCGCLQNDSRRLNRKTHGMSGFRPYYVWKDMKKRCYDKTKKGYKNYGGRGIKICKEWINNPNLFCEWMFANGYKKGMTIERINNDGDYKPSNCKLATMKEQCRNMRRNRFLVINGESKTISEWVETYRIPYSTIYARVAKGFVDKDIIKPIAIKNRNRFAKGNLNKELTDEFEVGEKNK